MSPTQPNTHAAWSAAAAQTQGVGSSVARQHTLVGQQLDRYLLEAELGQGGMSVVYRGQDTHLGRTVAVKVMHAFLAEQAEARQRFQREAMAVARLDDPNIIEIYDYSGPNAELSYIVTELVDGAPLSEWLTTLSHLPPEVALIVGYPVAKALAHAHAHGVIHRDLKPENILVGAAGELKLTDFGIARMLDNQALTITGTLIGSPAYMAPEYIEGHATDARSDLFSLGAVLYQLAAGKLPFDGPTPHTVLKRIAASDYTAVEQANPAVSASLGRIITRCLAHDPDHRYPSADAVLQDMQALLEQLDLDPAAQRRALFASPETFAAELQAHLTERCASLGKSALAAHRHGEAMEHFDRVLSLAPGHAETRALLTQMTRRFRWRRTLGLAGVVAAGAALATFLAVMIGSEPRQAAPAHVAGQPQPPKAEPSSEANTTAFVPPDSVASPPERNVTFILRGPEGNLYVDNQLVAENARGGLSRMLPSGTYEARFETDGANMVQTFTVPETGPVQGVTLGPAPSESNRGATTPQPPRARKPRPSASSTSATAAPSSASAAPVPATQSQPPGSTNAPSQVEKRAVTFVIVGWAHVYLDGEQVREAATGKINLAMDFGQHTVTFKNPNFKTKTLELAVNAQRPPERLKIRLQPKPARLRLRGVPNGAVVHVGEMTRIINPETRALPISVPMRGKVRQELQIRVRKSGFAEFRTSMEFRPNQDRTLEVQLEPL